MAKKETTRDDLRAQNAVDEAIMDQAAGEQLEQAGDQSTPPADLAAELEAEKDRSLRLQAEMQNLRQRTSRELSDERRYAGLTLMRDVLSVLDNIDRAIAAAEKNTDADALLEGFRLVRQQLLSVLTQHHCEPIEAEGTAFNPDFHEAILQQPSDEHPAGNVMMEVQPGYRLHDRVVRPTQVIVSAGPAESGK